MTYRSLTDEAKDFITAVVHPGDQVVDATLGNGNDTLFLAQLVDPQGQVFGFDIQQSAIDSTRERLNANGMTEQVTLILAGHERMKEFITAEHRIKAVMFNLGYLPGSDKSCITRAETTLQALNASSQLLVPGGRLAILAYIGHPGGTEEGEAVEAWLSTLDPEQWRCDCLQPKSSNKPPRLYRCEKLS